jgi:mannose-6-phosphate isomerase-like protein (cupin superfamily)
MNIQTESAVAPIALTAGEGEARWFFGMLVMIKAGHATTGGRVSVLECMAPQNSSPPLHVHRREDKWFYVMEGELTFWVGGRIIEAPVGSFVYAPRDIPHTFMVRSPVAHFLVAAEPGGFDKFLHALSEPAEPLTLPPATLAPPDMGRVMALAAEYGIEFLGPPGIPAAA